MLTISRIYLLLSTTPFSIHHHPLRRKYNNMAQVQLQVRSCWMDVHLVFNFIPHHHRPATTGDKELMYGLIGWNWELYHHTATQVPTLRPTCNSLPLIIIIIIIKRRVTTHDNYRDAVATYPHVQEHLPRSVVVVVAFVAVRIDPYHLIPVSGLPRSVSV